MKIYKEYLNKNWKQDYNFSIETEDVLKLFLEWAQLKNNERLVVEDFGKGKAFKLVLDKRIEIYQRCGELKMIGTIRISELKEGLYNFLNCLYSYDFVASY